MTKPEVLMYWMLFFSEHAYCLTDYDRANLIDKGLFKDQKSVSNAIYQLKKNDYVCDTYGNVPVVCLTEKGLNYITQVLKQVSNQKQASNQQKPQFNTAAEELAKLQEENEKLKAENKTLKAENESLLADNKQWSETYKIFNL